MKPFRCACIAVALTLNGCIAVTVASTAASVGVSAGSMAVGAVTTVAKGAASVTGSVIEKAVQ